jgi:hypothetical protein
MKLGDESFSNTDYDLALEYYNKVLNDYDLADDKAQKMIDIINKAIQSKGQPKTKPGTRDNNKPDQESLNKISKSLRDRITEIEKLGYKVDHQRPGILNSNEKQEIPISLKTGFKYVIVACGDQDRIKTVQVELYEKIENKRTLLQNGRETIAYPGSSVINYRPDKENSYLISISAIEFIPGIITGRYYLIVASKSIPVDLK